MRSVMVAVGLVPVVLGASLQAQAACDPATQFTYTFQSNCPEPIWIGQRSTGDPASYPPESGNWALSGTCTTNADCPSGTCDANSGLCTCSSASDCPGGAPCGADDKCSTTAAFCVPQSWSSGTFWPRTGCVLDSSTTPATLTCETGACAATDNSGKELLDCSVNNGGGSPKNPVTQFEVTSTTANVNYDVSLAAGYNVETRAVPAGGGQVTPGTTDTVACYEAGCTADLNASCPALLQVLDAAGTTVIGCLDPCTRCQRANPSPDLQCDAELAETWTCGMENGPVTNLDLYCAKNFTDGDAQASPNQGVPTAFSQLDCAPGTTFVVPSFESSYALPAGMGICLFTTLPQSAIAHFNENGWFDAASQTTKNCGGLPGDDYTALADGTACGGYLTPQKDGGYYTGALGYTCQTATYPVTGGMQVSHLCMPPVLSGLGTCQADTDMNVPLYTAGAGVTNQAWLDSAVLAGGGTPYYVPFKTACQAAYAWQYDDASSGFGCTPSAVIAGGPAFSGFDVTFCGSRSVPGGGGGGGGGGGSGGGPTPDVVVALEVHGRAARLGRSGRGLLRIKGETSLPTTLALEDATVAVTDLLDEVGAGGELVTDGGSLVLSPRKRKKKVAVFETAAGAEPRVKVVLHRPRPSSERVRVIVIARRATIARPTVCAGSDATASLETALMITAGTTDTRIGNVGPWRCKREIMRAE